MGTKRLLQQLTPWVEACSMTFLHAIDDRRHAATGGEIIAVFTELSRRSLRNLLSDASLIPWRWQPMAGTHLIFQTDRHLIDVLAKAFPDCPMT